MKNKILFTILIIAILTAVILGGIFVLLKYQKARISILETNSVVGTVKSVSDSQINIVVDYYKPGEGFTKEEKTGIFSGATQVVRYSKIEEDFVVFEKSAIREGDHVKLYFTGTVGQNNFVTPLNVAEPNP